jgi:hypothetical protein
MSLLIVSYSDTNAVFVCFTLREQIFPSNFRSSFDKLFNELAIVASAPKKET